MVSGISLSTDFNLHQIISLRAEWYMHISYFTLETLHWSFLFFSMTGKTSTVRLAFCLKSAVTARSSCGTSIPPHCNAIIKQSSKYLSDFFAIHPNHNFSLSQLTFGKRHTKSLTGRYSFTGHEYTRIHTFWELESTHAAYTESRWLYRDCTVFY